MRCDASAWADGRRFPMPCGAPAGGVHACAMAGTECGRPAGQQRQRTSHICPALHAPPPHAHTHDPISPPHLHPHPHLHPRTPPPRTSRFRSLPLFLRAFLSLAPPAPSSSACPPACPSCSSSSSSSASTCGPSRPASQPASNGVVQAQHTERMAAGWSQADLTAHMRGLPYAAGAPAALGPKQKRPASPPPPAHLQLLQAPFPTPTIHAAARPYAPKPWMEAPHASPIRPPPPGHLQLLQLSQTLRGIPVSTL